MGKRIFRPGIGASDGGASRFVKKAALLFGAAIIAVIFDLPAISGSASGWSSQEGEGQEFFERRVRPILAANCLSCHNSEVKTAGLDLATPEGFLQGGESGPLVSKDSPESSRLLKVIGYHDSPKMPPTGRLKDEEIEALTAWVRMGAPWPGVEQAAKTAYNREPGREFSDAEKQFWSFQPVGYPVPPRVKSPARAVSPVDRFILRKLEEKGIQPAPPADKLTLLRRASYGLTGLPPTEREVRDFLSDKSPDAFKRVIERLLASPRYGERWGRHWLDVARYADSTGNDEDHRYPHAWRYRDYVIEAFNRDLPYDRFIREQLAGDLLPGDDPNGVNRRGIVATGFLALGPKAIAQQDKKKMLYDVYDEQVDVTSKAFLGLTISCARCHDHKFDPVLTRDYYSMVAIFASTRSFKNPDSHVSQLLQVPLSPKEEYDRYQAELTAHQEGLKRNKLAMEEITGQVKERLVKDWSNRLADYMLAARRVNHGKALSADEARRQSLSEEVLKRWVEYLKPGDKARFHLVEWNKASESSVAETAAGYQRRFKERLAEWADTQEKWRARYREALNESRASLPDSPSFEAGQDRFFAEVYFEREGPFNLPEAIQAELYAESKERLSELRREQEALKQEAPASPEMACAVEEGEPVEQKVLIRGDYNNPGADAPKGYPLILTQRHKGLAINGGSGRLQLAEWVASGRNPLTARVMVNRIWQWHFGEGLVRTPDNFGKMGERPTHPELLDYLARKFMESGWSVKSMHRLIMLSGAYRMASSNPALNPEDDPENRLFSRFPRRRLDIEEVRDGLLAIDGSIDYRVGGTLQKGTGTDGETSNARLSLNPEKLQRRTVYLPLRRANLPSLLNLFDFGDATTASGKRARTNVATQALFMLNSEFVQDRSRRVAEMLMAGQAPDKGKRLERAYLRILNRLPSAEEVERGLQYIEGYKAKFPSASAELSGWESFCRILMASNDFIYVD